MALEDFSLDLNLDQTCLGGKGREKKSKQERERKERDFKERSSTFSLDFPEIRPSVSGEARSKVAPHGKGYAWVPVLGSFDKLQKVVISTQKLIFLVLFKIGFECFLCTNHIIQVD